MRSLFLRIFLWFWVTLIAVVAVLVVFSPLLTQTRPRLARWENHAEDWVAGRVERVAQSIQRHGLEDHGGRPERGRHGPGHLTPPRVLVFDALGNEVSGQPSDGSARSLALQALEQGQPVAQRLGGQHLSARPVTDPSGAQLAVVGIANRPPRLADLLEPKFLLPRLGALAGVAGLLVFWLAFHLSSPVAALRSATRELASGNLAARAGAKVTRRRDEIGQLGRDFNAMAERIEELVGSQRQLLQDVSHELRSPLARLRVALELARRDAGERAHDRIELECERLEDLIGRLLELTRLQGAVVDSDPVDMSAVLREVVADSRFENSDVTVALDIASGTVVELPGDRRLLRSAIENIVRNAVDYSPTGSRVEVAMKCTGEGAAIRVVDRGPGVPDQALERIFEPFFRVEEARDLRHGGTGLGLAIAARAIRSHGGEVRAANREGGGLIVEIHLPA